VTGKDVRVITFNTAVGNPKITTRQRDFLELPFYREVIEGSDDAAILALQEVGPDQAAALKSAAAAGGRFRVEYIRRPRQGNALVIPDRYELLGHRSSYYVVSQLTALAKALWRAARRRHRLNYRQYLELRMWSRVRLRDRRGAGEFTIFNTHVSGDPDLRVSQVAALLRRVRRAARDGPVILAADLNTRPADAESKNPEQRRGDAAVRALFPPLEDMAPSLRDPRRGAIDWILATGFTPVGAKQYTDDSLQLPGLATADLISDHYAKEAVLRPALHLAGTEIR
jgi:endonuclease/exonuclease/phosphatase family metal-dependent hydrolase